jgi:hypothetical protein
MLKEISKALTVVPCWYHARAAAVQQILSFWLDPVQNGFLVSAYD